MRFYHYRKSTLHQNIDELDKDKSGVLSSEDVVAMFMRQCKLRDAVARNIVNMFDKATPGEINRKDLENMINNL